MPTFQEGQPDCYFVAKTGVGWAALSYTPKLRVWQADPAGLVTPASIETTMTDYSGAPTWAKVSTGTAFPAGDGDYFAQVIFYNGASVRRLATEVVNVKVKNNLPEPA